ncbi:hypothetical protein H5410_021427 [Solanum commersonii]|uniref:Uncharacterized protein n=1 Tax=Solanum commersonii TaxID=4109 RepID=A0A9J5ZBY7_SOLCO|nr:hypothetical protein H5410_021427 [Solanum commersonii]
MELPSIASHLANMPSMTIDEQKMFGRHSSMILPKEAERMRRFVKGLIIPIRLGVSQVAVSGVSLEKVVDVAKELEIIQYEGFEQREENRTRYSCDYGGAPPKSRGYLGGVITLSLPDPFILLYQLLRLVTL